MKNTKKQLLSGVKIAVAQYGIEGLTVRNLAEAVGINDGLIYHYFKDKDTILKETYEAECDEIVSALIGHIKEAQTVPLPFESKIRLLFHRLWREFLSDRDRLLFMDRYSHSIKFSLSLEFHSGQIALLQKRLEQYFQSEDAVIQMIYAVRAQLYDVCTHVAFGQFPDTSEMEEMSFSIFYGIVCTQFNERKEVPRGQMSTVDEIGKNEIGGRTK